MTENRDYDMERKRRQEDEDRQKRESRYLAIIVGHALGLLIMLGFYWAILVELKNNQVRMIDTVSRVALEQARRTPTIERANEFMDEHTKEHLEYWQGK